MQVPLALLYQICFPAGHRPVKKELWKPVADSRLPARYLHNGEIVQDATRVPSMEICKDGLYRCGNLREELYRYFIGQEDKMKETCECRWCARQINVEIGIPIHRQNIGKECCHMIDVTIAILGQDNVCVTCGKHTMSKRWGIPLCWNDSMCEYELRFGMLSDVWESAAKAAKALRPGDRVGHVTV